MQINICGVPEHFNLPWQLGIKNKLFEKESIILNWKNVPEGTGKMCEMLRKEETDIAIILTEGIIKDISNGNTSVIVQKYVETPLIWGVHIPCHFSFNSIKDLKNQKIAISRIGSGSHLMSMLWAKKNHWDFNANVYEIVNTINGAKESLSKNESTIFLWEKFMTKPLVDAQIFRRIEDFPTPWPCFVIAVREEFLIENKTRVQKILKIINTITKDFKQIPEIVKTIANTFHLQENDVKEWLESTEWSQENLDKDSLAEIQNQLIEVGIINKKIVYQNLIQNIL